MPVPIPDFQHVLPAAPADEVLLDAHVERVPGVEAGGRGGDVQGGQVQHDLLAVCGQYSPLATVALFFNEKHEYMV